VKITIERVLSDEATNALYPTYLTAWESLLTKAAARHVLTLEEFAKEMSDPRIEKYVVRDGAGVAVALTTMTCDLSTMDWINQDYYASRYPDAVARGTMFYLGYTIVDATRRRSSAFMLMAAEVNRRVAEAGGVVGFDICAYNDAFGIGRHTARLFGSSHHIDTLDAQTYYAADYSPAGADGDQPRGNHPTVHPGQREDSPTDAISGSATPVQLTTLAERMDLADDIAGVLASRWPAFMLAGEPSHGVDLEELLLATPQNQVLLLDAQGTVIGVALSIPLHWDGTIADLPAGWDDAIRRSSRQLADGTSANTTCAISITIAPTSTRRHLANTLLDALRQVARDAGSRALLAPIRPILKSQYPLIPMESYLTWRTPNDQVFDPWLRMHLRAGGEMLAVAPESMVITAGTPEWERWLDCRLPGDGQYLVPGGLAPLRVDTASGIGTYQEPNIWIAHRLDPTPVPPG
jgi:hypothetical protein